MRALAGAAVSSNPAPTAVAARVITSAARSAGARSHFRRAGRGSVRRQSLVQTLVQLYRASRVAPTALEGIRPCGFHGRLLFDHLCVLRILPVWGLLRTPDQPLLSSQKVKRCPHCGSAQVVATVTGFSDRGLLIAARTHGQLQTVDRGNPLSTVNYSGSTTPVNGSLHSPQSTLHYVRLRLAKGEPGMGVSAPVVAVDSVPVHTPLSEEPEGRKNARNRRTYPRGQPPRSRTHRRRTRRRCRRRRVTRRWASAHLWWR